MPPSVTAHQLLQTALHHHQSGRLREAEVIYRQVLAKEPNDADATHFLGLIAQQVGKTDAALQHMRRALALAPNNPVFHINLAVILQELRDYEQALAHCRQAIALRPQFAEGHANFGAVLTSSGQPELAIEHLRRAIALDQRNLKAIYNLADALSKTGDYDQAIAEYERVLAIDANHAKAHFGLGLLRLLRGDFARGWEGYEWRWRTDDPSIPKRTFAQPLWDGGELHGATLLLFSEQGHGDAIQFIRYLPQVLERGGRVIVECLGALTPLFQQLSGVDVVSWGDPLPSFDIRCPLMTLPKVFGTTLQTIPAAVPYLCAPADRVERWRRRLEGDRGLKVGLSWSGNPRHTNDRERSMPAGLMSPLADVAGGSFYSLQKQEEAPASAAAPAELALHDFTRDLHDFADTAALIANLDLVISVDTAVAHLAGALGRPVWLMVPFVPDWRWLLNQTDSPWYPTMRIFRQPRRRDWPGVVRQVGLALSAMAPQGTP